MVIQFSRRAFFDRPLDEFKIRLNPCARTSSYGGWNAASRVGGIVNIINCSFGSREQRFSMVQTTLNTRSRNVQADRNSNEDFVSV